MSTLPDTEATEAEIKPSDPANPTPKELKPKISLKPLGVGTYGTIWRIDDRTVKKVAELTEVKTHDLSAATIRELCFLSTFSHPHIRGLMNIERSSPHEVSMIMRDGGLPLNEWVYTVDNMKRLQCLPIIAVQILAVLVYLEGLCMSHGDLKPSNILISRNLRVRIIDWGAVCFHPRFQTNNCCTAEFAAPELNETVARNSPAADVFSLGLIIRFLIYRRYETEQWIRRQCQRSDRVQILDLPEAINSHSIYHWVRACQPMLETNPSKRPLASVVYAWPQFSQYYSSVFTPPTDHSWAIILPDPIPSECWTRLKYIRLQDRTATVVWFFSIARGHYPREFITLGVDLMDEYLALHAPVDMPIASLKPLVLASYMISISLFSCSVVTSELAEFCRSTTAEQLGAMTVELLEVFKCRVYRRTWSEAVVKLNADCLLKVLISEAALGMSQLDRLNLYESLIPAQTDPNRIPKPNLSPDSNPSLAP